MMYRNVLLKGMLAMALAFGLVLTGCDTGTSNGSSDNGGGIPTPASNVAAFTGVNGSDIYEIVNTTAHQRSAVTADGWAVTNTYKVFKNGVELTASGGTVTAIDEEKITFSQIGNLILATGQVSIGGTSVTVSAPVADTYYCIGAQSQARSDSDITSTLLKYNVNPNNAEGVLWVSIAHASELYRNYPPDDASGNWDRIKTFAKEQKCPDSVVTQTANKLNNAVSAWGYYKASSGYMVVFFITRSSAVANRVKSAINVL